MSLLQNKSRLVIEVNSMKEKYPGARLVQEGNTLIWFYTVMVEGRGFPIRVVYPDNYPAGGPRIFSENRLPASPHLLANYELCWTNVYQNNGHWRPEQHTAVVAITEAHRWFANYLVWNTTGRWPARSNH